jgi:hypothetical protein
MTDLAPSFDADGYPTAETLETIERWPWRAADTCLDFVRAAWHWPEYVREDITAGEAEVLHAEPRGRYVRFATGGWSGNESLIAALRHNQKIHFLCWRLTAFGGLHIYQYPDDQRATG